jgi:hypothetical protein
VWSRFSTSVMNFPSIAVRHRPWSSRRSWLCRHQFVPSYFLTACTSIITLAINIILRYFCSLEVIMVLFTTIVRIEISENYSLLATKY